MKLVYYRARITTKHEEQLVAVTRPACLHEHVKPTAAAKCAAVKLRAVLNGPAHSLPVEASFRVETVVAP